MAASEINLCHKLKRQVIRGKRDWPNTGKPCVSLRSGASAYILLALASCDASRNHFNLGKNIMNLNAAAQPLIALIAGVLILIMPRLLNYVVAIYLIIVGLLGLFPLLR